MSMTSGHPTTHSGAGTIAAVRRSGCKPMGATPHLAATTSPQAPAAFTTCVLLSWRSPIVVTQPAPRWLTARIASLVVRTAPPRRRVPATKPCRSAAVSIDIASGSKTAPPPTASGRNPGSSSRASPGDNRRTVGVSCLAVAAKASSWSASSSCPTHTKPRAVSNGVSYMASGGVSKNDRLARASMQTTTCPDVSDSTDADRPVAWAPGASSRSTSTTRMCSASDHAAAAPAMPAPMTTASNEPSSEATGDSDSAAGRTRRRPQHHAEDHVVHVLRRCPPRLVGVA
jgi:hypothetical protein